MFAFMCMCTQFLHHIHPPMPFPCHLPHPTGINTLPVFQFCRGKKAKKKEKSNIFLYGISMHICTRTPTGSSLFCCFFSLYLSTFLIVVSISLWILQSFLYRENINHIYLINFLLLPSTSHMWLPLSVAYCDQ
jgi:hypothetical protein